MGRPGVIAGVICLWACGGPQGGGSEQQVTASESDAAPAPKPAVVVGSCRTWEVESRSIPSAYAAGLSSSGPSHSPNSSDVDKELIRRQVRRHTARVAYCVGRADVVPTGPVVQVSAARSTDKNIVIEVVPGTPPELAACLRRALDGEFDDRLPPAPTGGGSDGAAEPRIPMPATMRVAGPCVPVEAPAALSDLLPAMQQCFEAELATTPWLAGRLTLRVDRTDDSRTSVDATDFADPLVAMCIDRALTRYDMSGPERFACTLELTNPKNAGAPPEAHWPCAAEPTAPAN